MDDMSRVRALLITADRQLVTIKRVRPGRAPYWVLPGGHVEPDDRNLEAALHREIHEELAGRADIHSLLQVARLRGENQYIYLARIHHWNFAERSGPEFTRTDRGEYIPDLIPLTLSALSGIDLLPPETAELLRRTLTGGTDLFELPDIRTNPLVAHVPEGTRELDARR
ncbi:MAG TPA: NUDIX domain-containing protein [Streptosporangiaceae bacterium]|nr:NUDIX domain-containing protein [Streptosporangiaceae bacterium]